MYGKMRAITVSVCHTKNRKKEYICQVFPSFKFVLIFNCDENDDVQEKIRNSARWAYRNDLSKSSITV